MKYYLVILLVFDIYAPPKKDLSIIVPAYEEPRKPKLCYSHGEMIISVPEEPYRDFFTDYNGILQMIERGEDQSAEYVERFALLYGKESQLSHCLEQFRITSYIYKNSEVSAYFVLESIECHDRKSIELIQNFFLSYQHVAFPYIIQFKRYATLHNNSDVLGYLEQFSQKESKPKRVRICPKTGQALQIPNQF